MAFAPPPGTMVFSRCFKISTGASRETREISPNTNSSATKSPSTATVTLGNELTICFSRSVSLGCLFMNVSGILSCGASALANCAQHGVQRTSFVQQFHLDRDDRQRLQRRKKSA